MIAISTRLAQPADLPRAAELFDQYRQFYGQAPDLAGATGFLEQRVMRSESVLLLAERSDQEIIGFCQLYPSFCSVEMGAIYVLYDLYVHPQARNAGAAKALLKAAESRARNDGMARIDLTTARDNLTAQSVYKSMGWVRDKVFLTYTRAVTL